jgi:CBS domain-containing protein
MGKTVQEVMTSNPSTVESSTSIVEAAEIMRREDVGSVPVVEDGRLVGILTDRDIVIRAVAEARDPRSVTCGDIASRHIATIDPHQAIEDAERLMATHQVRRLPVCEEDGRLVGIVAQADVVRNEDAAKAGEMVEEISR